MNKTEPIVAVLPGLQQRQGFLGLRVVFFNLLITPERLVFAAVPGQLMKQAVAQARAEAKAQGAGIMGQWGAQFAWLDGILQGYEGRTVEAILAEYPGSYSLARADVRRIRTRTEEDDEGGRTTHEVRIDAAGAKYRFQLANKTADEARRILGEALPGLVR